MAIEWRCPVCESVCRCDEFVEAAEVSCIRCSQTIRRDETLCVVCDSPNPWRHRDSLHLQCAECGNTQTWYSHLIPA